MFEIFDPKDREEEVIIDSVDEVIEILLLPTLLDEEIAQLLLAS